MDLRTVEIAFAAADEFAREYADNVANGGVFVGTSESFAIRDKVRVRLVLAFAGETVELDGEIVHIVNAAVAAAGARPGVAVHFDTPASELRARFEPLLARTRAAPPEPRDDRRQATRSRARVGARVRCEGWDDVEGRTRDLSITGVLVSVSGVPPIAVDEPVEVFLANPETGSEQRVLGRVARHVKSEHGIVRAIGVQFFVPPEDRAETLQFLASLASIEHSRHLGGIRGSIGEAGVAGLLRKLGPAAREGTLDVIRGTEEGYVAFESGALRAARLGGATGVKALSRMLRWRDGSFEFHARVDPSLPAAESMPLDAALREASSADDGSGAVGARDFPPDAVLHVDEARRAAAGAIDKLEAAVLDLAVVGMNVQCVLDVVPEPDAEIRRALARLVDEGIVEVRSV